jgi:photoactive yellow protein
MIQTGILKSFVPDNMLSAMNQLTPPLADNLPFGVVKLDDHGSVIIYNKYNSKEFADFKPLSVVGKNYFTEVAPCSNNFIFSGRFKRGVAAKEMNFVFDYVFTYKLAPTKVRVHLFRDSAGSNWIFVKKH